jgi:hypothetical protein
MTNIIGHVGQQKVNVDRVKTKNFENNDLFGFFSNRANVDF